MQDSKDKIIQKINEYLSDKTIISAKQLTGTTWLAIDKVVSNSSNQEIGLFELWFSGDWRLINNSESTEIVSSDDKKYSLPVLDEKLAILQDKNILAVAVDQNIVNVLVSGNLKIEIKINEHSLVECSVYKEDPKTQKTTLKHSLGYNPDEESGWYEFSPSI